MMMEGMMMEEKPADMMEAMEGGEVEFEGGDDMMMEGMDMGMGGDMMAMMEASVTDPRTKSTDEDKFAAWADVPACFLRNCIHNPFFGDIVKAHVVNHEFFQGKAKHDTWGGVAGLMTSGIVTSERKDADTWFSGYVGDLDLESLMGMANNGAILFPGWVEGWTSEQDAVDYVKTLEATKESKETLRKVVCKVTNASVMTTAGNRAVAHRLQGTVTKVEPKDGTTFIEITGLPHDDQTIAQAAEAALAAKKLAEEEAAKAKAGGDMMMEGMGMEGMGMEMEMEKPAEGMEGM